MRTAHSVRLTLDSASDSSAIVLIRLSHGVRLIGRLLDQSMFGFVSADDLDSLGLLWTYRHGVASPFFLLAPSSNFLFDGGSDRSCGDIGPSFVVHTGSVDSAV